MMQLQSVAYESEYLIKMDVPLWYLTKWLNHVIHNIKLIGNGLVKMKAKYDTGALKSVKDLSAHQPSPRTKEDNGLEDITVGFEDKQMEILDQLVGTREQLQIISIFGMPGIGKTTLAKKLFDHPLVTYQFDRRVWCVISQMCQKQNILTDILFSLWDEPDKPKTSERDEEMLAQHIYQKLKGRRFLIVMDDIWDSYVWQDLQRIFPDDNNGSRILFTNRNKDVAPSDSIIHELPLLSNDQCWQLLANKVFHGEQCPPHLKEIGMEIAAKCNGLPLAAVVVAGILSSLDMEESTWKNVGKDLESSMFSDQSNSVMQILELSYNHLPRHLKPCFLYFGVFPEDNPINVRKLKWLWIAEGFIHKEDQKGADSVAEEYIIELIDKSLIIVTQNRSEGGAKVCIIHDLLRQLCLRIADRENFLKVVDRKCSMWSQKYHRMSVQRDLFAPGSDFVPYGQRFRTFFGSLSDVFWCLDNMKLLKILDSDGFLYHYDSKPQMATRVHLKFLSVWKMPESLFSFVNLEVLIVNDDIPIYIREMVKLKYLHANLATLIYEEGSTSQTNNLEYLSNVKIQCKGDAEMLRCSPNLRRLKCECESLSGENCLDLHCLIQLESLTVRFFGFLRPLPEIKLPSNIKKLNLSSFRFPWEKMSAVGALPNLVSLKLQDNAFVGERWDTNDDDFQQLKFLKLKQLNLQQWNVSSSRHFPKLQQLVLECCNYLEEIPAVIGEIETLQLISVARFCRKAVKESARKIQQEREDMGDDELRVIIAEF